eukprot:CAMPEP_0184696238 /NCGR_PEP_ID=MMETSP0313-20130426/3598_1 /TAXON_ID=2792 /ORGANISM="Porphyridium aerugineum, Strain SAG 1380-2" /LENGTH=46 /DNA_ID= /DNA_START= /DNA_END= /DNA_ORIENTATION=
MTEEAVRPGDIKKIYDIPESCKCKYNFGMESTMGGGLCSCQPICES